LTVHLLIVWGFTLLQTLESIIETIYKMEDSDDW